MAQPTKACLTLFVCAAIGCNEAQHASRDAAVVDGSVPHDAAQANICPPDIAEDPWWSCSGPKLGTPIASYSGWSTIERSTETDLIVYISPERLKPPVRDDDAGVGIPMDGEGGGAHCSIGGSTMPVYPVGTRVWLSESHDNDFYLGIPRQHQGSSMTLRESEGGVLIAAGVGKPTDGTSISVGNLLLERGDVACEQRRDMCRMNGRMLSYELSLRGDKAMTVRPGDRAALQIAGRTYDLTLASATRSEGGAATNCSDYVVDNRLWVRAGLRARDANTQLPIEPLPSCVVGNDLRGYQDFYVSRDEIHGLITYARIEGANYRFDAPDDNAFSLGTSVLAEPSAGQTFWLDASYHVYVLRESENGPVLSAAGNGGGAAEALSDWLKTEVRYDQACEYESVSGRRGDTSPTYLYTVRIGSDPETRVESGRRQELQLDGHTYDVAFWGVSTFPTLTIARKD